MNQFNIYTIYTAYKTNYLNTSEPRAFPRYRQLKTWLDITMADELVPFLMWGSPVTLRAAIYLG